VLDKDRDTGLIRALDKGAGTRDRGTDRVWVLDRRTVMEKKQGWLPAHMVYPPDNRYVVCLGWLTTVIYICAGFLSYIDLTADDIPHRSVSMPTLTRSTLEPLTTLNPVFSLTKTRARQTPLPLHA